MDDDEKFSMPSDFREVSIVTLNNSIRLRSTFRHESMDFLLGKSLGILEHLKKVDKE